MRTVLDSLLIFPLLTPRQVPLMFCAVFAVLLICPQSRAQTVEPGLRRFLVERAGFDANRLAALERGDPVVKVIPSNDRREVAVSGLIQLHSSAESALKAFQLSLSLDKKSILQSGKFTEQPRVEDVAALTLGDGDVEDLRTCMVGNCKLKLSAAMIERFQKSIDWKAADYKEQANQLFRLMIVEYVTAYIQDGDLRLIEYADASQRVSLAREQEALLNGLSYLYETAPELVHHLKALPQSSLPVQRSLSWAVISFGLKPVLVINDTYTYRSELRGAPRVLVLAKQIYASHYFDSSLSLTASVANQTGTKTNLLYVNRSRASALASLFSGIKHEIVERRVTEHLTNLLGETRLNVDVVVSNSAPPLERTYTERITTSSALRTIAWFVLLIVIARIGVYARSGWKRQRSGETLSNRSSEARS